MTELVAWVAFPALALVASVGVGLLVERAGALELNAALVAPLGFCASMVLVGLPFAAGLGAWAAAGAVAAAAAAGLWQGRRELRNRLSPGTATLAGLGAYALHMAPVLLSGKATFLGYNLLNDTAVHFTLVDYLSEHGRLDHDLPASSFAAAIHGYLGSSYPLGSHELLAALRFGVGTDVAHVYQPFLALSVGLTSAALVAMLRDLGAGRAAAASAAVLAVAGQLYFSFTLQGGIKELTFVAALATAAALGAALPRARQPVRGAAVLALPLLGAYAIYGVAALAWIGPLVLLLALLVRFGPETPLRRRLLPAALAGAAVFALLGAPTIVDSIDFYRGGEAVLTSQDELGPLAGPLRAAQVSGVWLNGDYRRGPSDTTLNWALICVALALAGAGTLLAAWRRMAGPLLVIVPAFVAWAAVSGSGSPYVDAKLLGVGSPAAGLAAALGVAALWRGRTRAVAVLAAAVLVGSFAVSDALAYRLALPAPIDRLEELSEIGSRFAGDEGPMLVNQFEEYAKHFARDARPSDPYEAWTIEPARLRGDPRPLFGNAYTLDELGFDFVIAYPLIALRRSPAESRPPAGYERVFRGRYYEVWRRDGQLPAVEHLSLGFPEQTPVSAASVPPCSLLRDAGTTADLIAAERSRGVVFDLATSDPLPPAWERGAGRYELVARGPGTVSAQARTEAGRHTVWVKGIFHRRSRIAVDGRHVGSAKELNGPNEWVEVGAVDLSAGLHSVSLERPGGSLAPGDSQGDPIGPLVLVRSGEPRLLAARKGRWRTLCRRPLDWVERVPAD